MSYKSTGKKSRPEREKAFPSKSGSTPLVSDDFGLSSRRHRRDSESSISSSSSTVSFHSTHSRQNEPSFAPATTASSSSSSSAATPAAAAPVKPLKFTPSQEQLHVTASNDLKSQANTQFSRGDFSSALQTYDRAIAELPVYLDYELAVLQSNIAACHLRLEEWREAVAASDKGWDCLESIDPSNPQKATKDKTTKTTTDLKNDGGDDETIIELPESNTDADDAELLKTLALSDQRRQDVRRIRTKLLLRRARARYLLGTTTTTTTQRDKENQNPFAQASALASSSDPSSSSSSSAWSNLNAAHSDYQQLSSPDFWSYLPVPDQKTVRHALLVLPPLVEQAKEKEVAEMMGKLKELGNGILKPFGLSTNMFKMEKDPVSGGMSLRFDGASK